MAKSTGPKPPEKPRAAAPRARRTEAKPALKLVVPVPTPVPVPVPTGETPALVTLRKKDLVERVCEASGLKKKDVKPVIEATLRVLGDALEAGSALAIPPLGKARVNRQTGSTGDEVLVVKLRRPSPAATAAVTAAEPGEDDN